VLGSSFSVADLSVVTGRRASELAPLVREATEAGVFRPAGQELTWRHDMVQDAIYQDVPPPMRRALHVQSARALAAAGDDALKVAAHFSLGASPGDVEAVIWLWRAAREAAPRDAAVRAELLDRALQLIPEDSPQRGQLEVEHAGSLLWSGRVADAEGFARAVLDQTGRPELKEAARSVLSLALFFQNRMGAAGVEFESAAEDPATPEKSRLGLLSQAAMGHLQGGDPEKAVALAQKVVAAGEEKADHFATAIGYSVLAWVDYFSSNVASSIELQRRAAAEADLDTTGEAHRRHPFLAPGLMLLEGDQMEEATESFRSGLELGERLGIVWHLPLYHYGLGKPSFYEGRWDDMRAEFETAWDLTEETGSNWGSVAYRCFAAWAAVHLDELEDAQMLLDDAQAALERQGPTMESVWSPWATGVFLDATGRQEEGLAVFSRGWDLFSALGLMIAFRLLGPDLTRMCAAAGDKGRAQAVAEQLEEHASRAEVPSAQGAALQCRGLADDNPDVLVEGVEAYRKSPRVVHLALAAEDAGACLARHDRTEEAVEHLKEALDIYDRTRMRRDARRAEERLRSLGVRRGARGRRARPQHGWDSLTSTQARVASLAATGMTNPEIAERLFISRRTVETHMSHVLAKLGLSSRVELAAEAARRAATS
jgi:DNA-binding CsgD family transcriptional regulator